MIENDNILLTGSTGFLGKIIVEILGKYYHISTIGRIRNFENHISFDLTNSDNINLKTNYNLVIHCAGKAHSVPKTDIEKEDFFNINQFGTKRLLDGLDKQHIKPKAFVFISSVAVYGLISGINIIENTPLNAIDPYGKSKILAEELVKEWCNRNNVICTILRLPLLVGKNPKGNLASMINAIKRGYYLNIGGGEAKKSMVLAEDVAMFIPKVVPIGGIYNLTDGYHPNFNELSNHVASQLGKSKLLNLPKNIIYILAKIGDLFGDFSPINSQKYKKITSDLTFDDTKARKLADWNPTLVLEGFKID